MGYNQSQPQGVRGIEQENSSSHNIQSPSQGYVENGINVSGRSPDNLQEFISFHSKPTYNYNNIVYDPRVAPSSNNMHNKRAKFVGRSENLPQTNNDVSHQGNL